MLHNLARSNLLAGGPTHGRASAWRGGAGSPRSAATRELASACEQLRRMADC